jgi:mannitol/fructose-specific phosphotransferase system IIA component (Ntr-type)
MDAFMNGLSDKDKAEHCDSCLDELISMISDQDAIEKLRQASDVCRAIINDEIKTADE